MNGAMRQRSLQTDLSSRLRGRTPEIEEEILTRIYAVSDPTAVRDPEYVGGLRAAVTAAVRYALGGIETGKAASTPIPVELLAQVRSAARNRVPLDTVLRRYVAGHTLISDFVIQEAKAARLNDTGELQRLVRLQAELFDRVLEVIATEYQAGIESGLRSPHRNRIDCVTKLLAGQLVDSGELGYELSGWHVGVAMTGTSSEQMLREHARRHDWRFLFVSRAEGASWAWLGGVHRPGPEALDRLSSLAWPPDVYVAIGEPAAELSGWRLSHRQALAALPVAIRGTGKSTRYSDVALLASALQDEVLAASLCHLYLDPLDGERDGGETLRRTLRAYFATERNSASAASTLGITRQTVNNHLRTVEERLKRSLATSAADLEVALRLQELKAAGVRAGEADAKDFPAVKM